MNPRILLLIGILFMFFSFFSCSMNAGLMGWGYPGYGGFFGPSFFFFGGGGNHHYYGNQNRNRNIRSSYPRGDRYRGGGYRSGK